MEQANNTFTKGLLNDAHPMVLGNDSLSDALNATFVTMNGNEVILQNDMGNRRVDNAFLPAGYEPVGMKEYGGIIYVASYNPITNRSLIGSFPSPERRINILDNPSLGTNFNFSDFTSYNETLSGFNLSFLRSDVLIYPLSSDTSLHAGDKFVVYSNEIWSNRASFSNFNNIPIDPLNKQYTLYIGVLNSLNLFTDITKTLVRWNSSGQIIDTSNLSDEEAFNTGYFIAPTFSNPGHDESWSDARLIEERQKIPANTYSYKLVGPMHLKAELNHTENFNYNIYGTYKNGRADLWIEAFIEYNCPVNNIGFDFYPGGNSTRGNGTAPIYSKKTNTYTTKKLMKVSGVSPNVSGTDLLNYVIAVPAIGNTYLRGLTTEGTIDLSLLGSGEAVLNGWRFYNNLKEQTTLLTFMISAYPKYNSSFANLRLLFIDVAPDEDLEQTVFKYPAGYGLDVYNGRTNLMLNWNEIGLRERHLYEVQLIYDINGGEDAEDGKILASDKWLLTTELFNDCYDSNGGLFVRDYCEAAKESDKASDNEIAIVLDKLAIKLSFNSNLVNESTPSEEILGSLLNTPNTGGGSNIQYKCIHTYDIKLKDTPNVYITNENLYPKYITVKESLKFNTEITELKVTKVGNLEKTDENTYDLLFKDLNNMSFTKRGTVDVSNETFLTVNSFRIDSNNNVSGKIIYNDIYKSIGESKGEITNGFTSFENGLSEMLNIVNEVHYGCISLDWEAKSGAEDRHILRYISGRTEAGDCHGDGDSMPTHNDLYIDECRQLAREVYDGYWTYETLNFNSEIYQSFLDGVLNLNQVFSYRFKTNDEGILSDGSRKSTYPINASSNARVWWRTNRNGLWALFSKLFNASSNRKYNLASFISYLKSIITTKFSFCLYPQILCSQKGIYIPNSENESYNDLYNIPLSLEISYNHKDSSNIIKSSANNPPIRFNVNSNILNNINTFTILATSSSNFNKDISSTSNILLNNIDIDTGKRFDKDGYELDVNKIYKIVDGNLEIWGDCPMILHQSEDKTGVNVLYYNKYNTSALVSNQYDSTGKGGGDTFTLLKYNQVILIPNTI